MLRHIVMFKLRPCETESEKLELVSLLKHRLEELPALIPQIKEFEVGINIRKSDWNYDFVLNSVFENMEDLEIYSVHPAHQEFIAFNKDKSIAKTAADFLF